MRSINRKAEMQHHCTNKQTNRQIRLVDTASLHIVLLPFTKCMKSSDKGRSLPAYVSIRKFKLSYLRSNLDWIWTDGLHWQLLMRISFCPISAHCICPLHESSSQYSETVQLTCRKWQSATNRYVLLSYSS